MKQAVYLFPFLAGSVFLLVRAELLKKRRQIYIFKPASTLLLLLTALLSFYEPSHDLIYSTGILAGLVISLGGDAALMFPENRRAFSLGLALFLLAHTVYASVFMVLGRFSLMDIFPALVLLLTGVGFYSLIRQNLGKMRLPVIVYLVVISIMVSRAFSLLSSDRLGRIQWIMVASGAVLFYLSDIILATGRFWKPLRYGRISLAFYYSGQFLIALTASYFPQT